MKTTLTFTLALALASSPLGALAQQSPDHEHHGHAAQHQAPASKGDAAGAEKKAEKPTVGPHGGDIQKLGQLQIETVVQPGGLRLFAYDRQGQPLDLRNARGVATLSVEGNPKRYRYDLFPEIRKDQSAVSLATAVDLSRIAGRSVDLTFQLVGLPGAERRPITFATTSMAPMTEAQKMAVAVAKQKVCPVSNQPLGSMGQPIPVTVGKDTIYVCCEGCIERAKAHPEKYFAAKPELAIAPATAADAEAIARQKLCPVMDEPLGSMGKPLKVTGLERDIFLCCKGCLKFLKQEPAKYLAKLPKEKKEK